MAEANDPSSAAAAGGIQATPPAQHSPDPARIPLAPLRSEPITPEEMIRSTRLYDRVLVVVALLVAFFLASFSIRNSDLFLHMATGRALLRGDYHFGTDPFASTTAGIYWVNHAWLFDLLVYGVYQLGGGLGLVVTRCLIILGLAVFLMRTRRAGQSLWAPAGCTGLALLAMSPRFLMQPVLLSYLFLAATLYLLERSRPRFGVRWDDVPGRRHGAAEPVGWSPLWLLPPLFVLWVNCDDWFLLGPFTVILYGLGEIFQELFNSVGAGPDVADRSRRKTLALVTIACLAACLVNPHHIHGAFTLPAQLPLNPAALILEASPDREFAGLFARPSDPDYFKSTNLGGSRAALAVIPLLALGLVSFMLNSAGWRWWRGLVWAAFLLLGLYHGRAIPFFALVSAPIMALNFQDFAARKFGQSVRTERVWKEWSIGGRVLTVAAGIVLLATAWPGWLHNSPDNPQLSRRVAWDMRVDESLKQLAEKLGEWRQQGFLKPEDHGFNTTADIAHYCAWYCPEEKCFFDLRFELYPETAQSFLDIRKALDPVATDDPAAFEKLFRDKRHPINHVLLGGNRSFLTFARLASDESRWSLMHLTGQGAVFGWLDVQNPAGRDAFVKHRLVSDRLAFGRSAVQAPSEGPGRLPQRKEWWEHYPLAPLPQQAAGEEAQLFLAQFNSQIMRYQQRQQLEVAALGAAQAVTLPGLSFGLTGPRMLQTGTFILPYQLGSFMAAMNSDHDRGPPAAAFLAIRAARRALAVNPEDAKAHAALGQAYLRLITLTREGKSANPMPDPRDPFAKQLWDMRFAQAMSALENWALIEPDTLDVHRLLTVNYLQLNNREKAKEHLDLVVKLWRARGRLPGESLEDFAQQMADREKEFKDLDSDLNSRIHEFTVAAAGKPVMQKVFLAMQRGLHVQALQTLKDSDPLQFGPEGAMLQVDLELGMGRLEEANQDLKSVLESEGDDADKRPFQPRALVAAAAMGDYVKADAIAASLLEDIDKDPMMVRVMIFANLQPREEMKKTPKDPRTLLAINHANQVLNAGILGRPPAAFVCTAFSVMRLNQDLYVLYLDRLTKKATYLTLRGLLALEQGDTARARTSFEQAAALGKNQLLGPTNGVPLAESYLKFIDEAAKK